MSGRTSGERTTIATEGTTAKTNGIEPHAWLTDVLTRLPSTKDRDIDELLPLA
jgi:glucan phosphorylase